MTETQIREIKKHLVHGLNSITGVETSEVLAVENCPDDTDFASQLVQHGLNLAMHRRRLARIGELEGALRRLSETDYGMCEECGGEIGVARLNANPSTRLCVSCQADFEDGLNWCA